MFKTKLADVDLIFPFVRLRLRKYTSAAGELANTNLSLRVRLAVIIFLRNQTIRLDNNRIQEDEVPLQQDTFC